MEHEKEPSSYSQSAREPSILLYILFWLASIFAVSFFSKRQTPKTKPGEPIHQQDTPEKKTSAGPTPLRGVLMVETPVNPNKSEQNGTKKTPLWEKAAVFIALGLLVVNFFQMRATDRAANAAKESAELTSRQMESQYAAIIHPHYGIRGKQFLEVAIINQNPGRAIAKKISARFKYSVLEIPSLRQLSDLQTASIDEITVLKSEDSKSFDYPIIGFDWTHFENFEQGIRVEAEWNYDNGFTKTIYDRSCFVVLANNAFSCDVINGYIAEGIPKQ